jgi:hypothetical protein
LKRDLAKSLFSFRSWHVGSRLDETIADTSKPSKFSLGGITDVICIIFKFRDDMPKQAQNRILENVAAWDRNNQAGRLQLGNDDRGLCYVYVANDNAAHITLQRLQKTKEVEYARIPPFRQAAEIHP